MVPSHVPGKKTLKVKANLNIEQNKTKNVTFTFTLSSKKMFPDFQPGQLHF